MTEPLQKMVVPFTAKAIDEGARTFDGYAATWDLDLGGDVIHKGAFSDTIKSWKASGRSLPLLNSHNYFDVTSAVGQMLAAKEDDTGLLTTWEVIEGADGDAILSRLKPSARTKRAVIGAMSIGYMAEKFDFEQVGDDGPTVRNLRKVGLEEVSLVIFPMNTEALINVATVKMQLSHGTDEQKAQFKAMYDALGTVLVSEKEEVPEGFDTPGDPLADLKLRRLRSRSSALRAGINTTSQG